MKFVVDGMLGKLARWLRMLGHEVEYDPGLNDNDLLELARKNQAMLLTRDEELQRRGHAGRVQASLVKGNTEEERLAEMAREYGLKLVVDMASTRCPKCGGVLGQVSPNEIADKVPPTSLKLYHEYWKCTDPGCGKIYWRGSHWKQIDLMLANARKLLEAP